MDNLFYQTSRRESWPGEEINSLTITRGSQKAGIYEGKVVCNESFTDGGTFVLGWRARTIKGNYEIQPTNREGIELEGMLHESRFTHSPEFDEKLKKYISQEIDTFRTRGRNN